MGSPERMPEILLEHNEGGKHRKILRVNPERGLFVIGSSREADLRISGEGVQGCHAALRYRQPYWYVCDISGTETIKVDGKPVVEARIDRKAAIEIGSHRIELFTKERDTEIFKEDAVATGTALHQVVVRLRGRVVETKLLGAAESFAFDDGEKVHILPPPRDGKWVKTQFGKRVVQQRLVGAQEIISGESLRIDRDLRKPLGAALSVFLFMLATMLLLSSGKEAEKAPEVALDKKSMDIIFNAKAVQKRKMESRKVVKSAKARAGGTSEQASRVAPNTMPEEATAPQASGKASAAVTSLRQAGLANLVGKIAKRANRQGVLVAAQGVSPDTKGAGRAFYSMGSSTTGGGGTAAKVGPTYRLGGIATKGRAGGVGNVKDGTALAGGNIGSGDIVAMVDEETVIEGGLDRDAIAEVIRRNLGQIRYCYERQLSSNPDLYGKVLVKFTIGANGEVLDQRVDSSTLKSSMVEGCIMRRMAAWKFPEPKGGTLVRVSYPFLFKAH